MLLYYFVNIVFCCVPFGNMLSTVTTLHALPAEAEIKTIEIKRETDQFVILASDGLWDVMTSEEAVEYVHAVMAAAMGSDGEREKWSGSGGSGGDGGIEDGSSSMGSGGEGGGEGRNAPGKF